MRDSPRRLNRYCNSCGERQPPVAAGYTSDHAVLVQSLLLGEAALAKPLFGIIADRINGRRAFWAPRDEIDAGISGCALSTRPTARRVSSGHDESW